MIRQFRTPQFAGMTFYEVAAKSIVNHVAGNRYGFNWTINTFRGCSHACTYCLAGDTRITMADGTTKALADISLGDAICGTVAAAGRRRYVKTKVSAHWATTKAAWLVSFADGGEMVASGDHRFLSEDGWRYVAPGPRGDEPRAHLSRGSTLIGLGNRQVRVSEVKPLEYTLPMYDITTGTGDFIANGVVSHNCFARPTHTYLEFNAGADFERKIVVKVNAAELLRRELRRPTWKGELIAMGTNTDPYQRAEGHYKLMRGVLAELNAARNPYSILTKGTLIQRDLDLLVAGAAVTEVNANFSVGTVDEAVWAATEPGTPHPRKRLEVVRMLNDAGIPCGVLMAPILPGISDSPEQLAATVQAAAEAGATHITPITLHLRPGVKEEFMAWLAQQHPELVDRYTTLYPHSEAPKEVTEAIGRSVGELRRRHGVHSHRATGGRGGPAPAARLDPQPPAPAATPAPAAPSEQLALSLDLPVAPVRRVRRSLSIVAGSSP